MRTPRLKTGAYKSKELATRPARRVPEALRFGAALVYVLIHYKPAGRDPAGAGRSRVFALVPCSHAHFFFFEAARKGGTLEVKNLAEEGGKLFRPKVGRTCAVD